MSILIHKPNSTDLAVIKNLVETGKIMPVIDRTFPLSKTADAMRYYGKGFTKGKVVIEIEKREN